eukprot:10092166-Lingulodinium_polyedra.AAC.1
MRPGACWRNEAPINVPQSQRARHTCAGLLTGNHARAGRHQQVGQNHGPVVLHNGHKRSRASLGTDVGPKLEQEPVQTVPARAVPVFCASCQAKCAPIWA